MQLILAISFILLCAFTQKATSENPGTMTFTMDYKLEQENLRLKKVENNDEGCVNPLLTFYPIKFKIDWKDCAKPIKESKMLKNMKIRFNFADNENHASKTILVDFENYSDYLMEQFYAGGKAHIFVKDDQLVKFTYLKNPSGLTVHPAGIFTMNVKYEAREDVFFDKLAIRNFRMHSYDCIPVILENGKKFALNLANCNVRRVEDLRNLEIGIRFVLDYAPGKTVLQTIQQTVRFIDPDDFDLLERLFVGGVENEATIVFRKRVERKRMEYLIVAGTSQQSRVSTHIYTKYLENVIQKI